MKKIRLGGIKILEGCSCLAWARHEAENALADICGRLGEERINLSQVAYLARDPEGRCATCLCTDSRAGIPAFLPFSLDAPVGRNAAILSVFPHDRRPLVIGTLLELLGAQNTRPLGIASSPSAVSVVVPDQNMKTTIDSLFAAFEFPSYGSPLEWRSAYVGKEQLFKDVVGAYEEQDIKVYAVLDQPGLDLWRLILAPGRLVPLGAALKQLDLLGVKMPFLAAWCNHPGETILAFCLPASQRESVTLTLDAHLPHAPRCLRHAAGIFFHGPHFGDRYRIAATLTHTLRDAGIDPLALNCAVHSISLILEAKDLSRGLQTIKTRFHVPSGLGY